MTGISAVVRVAGLVFSRGGRGVRGGLGLPSLDTCVRSLSLGRGEEDERAAPGLFGLPGLRAPGLLPVLLLAAASRTSL